MSSAWLLLALYSVCLLSTSVVEANSISDDELVKTIQDRHNSIRRRVALGAKILGKKYGPAKNMYGVRWDWDITALARIELGGYQKFNDFGRNTYSMNIHKDSPLGPELLKAVMSWRKNATSFNQIIFARNDKIGCAYKLLPVPEYDHVRLLKVLCFYNKRYWDGTEVYEEGTACKHDKECTTYSGSSCWRDLCWRRGY